MTNLGYMTSNVFAIAKLAGLALIIACGMGFLAIVGPGNLQVILSDIS